MRGFAWMFLLLAVIGAGSSMNWAASDEWGHAAFSAVLALVAMVAFRRSESLANQTKED